MLTKAKGKESYVTKTKSVILSAILLMGMASLPFLILMEIDAHAQLNNNTTVIDPNSLINQISSRVEAANTGTNAAYVQQILTSLSSRTEHALGQTKAMEEIHQISLQVSTYPYGVVSQALSQLARYVANNTISVSPVIELISQFKSSGKDVSQAIVDVAVQTSNGGPSNLSKQISLTAQLIAKQSGAHPAKIESILKQLTIQSAKAGGSDLALKSLQQIISQINKNPVPLKQAIGMLANSDDMGKTGQLLKIISGLVKNNRDGTGIESNGGSGGEGNKGDGKKVVDRIIKTPAPPNIISAARTPGAPGTTTVGGTKTLPGIPNSVAFEPGSQLVGFLPGYVFVRNGPLGGPVVPLPIFADIRFGPDSKPIGVVCPIEFPCGQAFLQSAPVGVSVPQSAPTTPAAPAPAGPTPTTTPSTAAPAPAGLPAKPTLMDEYNYMRDKIKDGTFVDWYIDQFNQKNKNKTSCKVVWTLYCAMAGAGASTLGGGPTPLGVSIGGTATTVCLLWANNFCDEQFKEGKELPRAVTDCAPTLPGEGKPPACEPTTGNRIPIKIAPTGPTPTTTPSTAAPAPAPTGPTPTTTPSTAAPAPAPTGPTPTTTPSTAAPANTPAPSSNIGGLGTRIAAGETSTTPQAPDLVLAEPTVPSEETIPPLDATTSLLPADSIIPSEAQGEVVEPVKSVEPTEPTKLTSAPGAIATTQPSTEPASDSTAPATDPAISEPTVTKTLDPDTEPTTYPEAEIGFEQVEEGNGFAQADDEDEEVEKEEDEEEEDNDDSLAEGLPVTPEETTVANTEIGFEQVEEGNGFAQADDEDEEVEKEEDEEEEDNDDSLAEGLPVTPEETTVANTEIGFEQVEEGNGFAQADDEDEDEREEDNDGGGSYYGGGSEDGYW